MRAPAAEHPVRLRWRALRSGWLGYAAAVGESGAGLLRFSSIPAPLEAVVYRALRRQAAERYQSMADLRHDLLHLDEVSIPVYRPDQPPPTPPGDLPPLRTTVPILLAIFGALLVLGLLAECTHRNLTPH